MAKLSKVVVPKANRGSFGGFFLNSMIEGAKEKTSGGSLVASDAERVIIGVPIPALSAQILHGSDVDPLGRMKLFCGDSTAGKSALSWNVSSWPLRFDPDAGANYILNEPRDSPDYRRSVYTDELIDRVIVTTTRSCEEWQRHLTSFVLNLEKTFKARSGCAWPGTFILDSTTGTTSERVIAKIEEDGHASPSFPIVPNLIDQYLHFFLPRMMAWPLNLICCNHLKWGQHPQNPQLKVLRIPGGAALMFYSTYVFQVTRGKDISRGGIGGYTMDIKTLKMFGQGNRRMSVDLLWWGQLNEATGKVEQQTVFDWHSATVEHIMGLPKAKFDEVSDIITFPTDNNQARTCNCPVLGIKKPIPYNEVGYAIMQDRKILTQLQDYFAVKRRCVYQPGVPYDQQIKEAIKTGSLQSEESTQVKGKEIDDQGSLEIVEGPDGGEGNE